jgi:hypothetical protein
VQEEHGWDFWRGATQMHRQVGKLEREERLQLRNLVDQLLNESSDKFKSKRLAIPKYSPVFEFDAGEGDGLREFPTISVALVAFGCLQFCTHTRRFGLLKPKRATQVNKLIAGSNKGEIRS